MELFLGSEEAGVMDLLGTAGLQYHPKMECLYQTHVLERRVASGLA